MSLSKAPVRGAKYRKPKSRRWVKNQTSRLRRRITKGTETDLPKHITEGWND